MGPDRREHPCSGALFFPLRCGIWIFGLQFLGIGRPLGKPGLRTNYRAGPETVAVGGQRLFAEDAEAEDSRANMHG